MEVILLENIGNLGSLGDKVDVKAGFGRNDLIPQGKAVPATEAAVAEFEARRAELEAAAAEALAAAQSRADAIGELGLIGPDFELGLVQLGLEVGESAVSCSRLFAGCLQVGLHFIDFCLNSSRIKKAFIVFGVDPLFP